MRRWGGKEVGRERREEEEEMRAERKRSAHSLIELVVIVGLHDVMHYLHTHVDQCVIATGDAHVSHRQQVSHC